MTRPTVLISSTIAGFGDLRGALYYELSRRGYQPYLSEENHFPASGDREALSECLRIAESVDVYVLLIGHERGARLNETSSPTREEFRAARAMNAATGKPKLVLNVRAAVRSSMDYWQGAVPDVEDPEFVRSFIQEVEATGFVFRFAWFTDLMATLETALKLGVNDIELGHRRAVLDEVLLNISTMCGRAGSSVLAHHEWVAQAREAIGEIPYVGLDSLAVPMALSRDVATSLAGCFTMGHSGALRTVAMQEAVLSGAFMVFHPDDAGLIPSDLHKAIELTRRDVESLRGFARGQRNWLAPLLTSVGQANRARQDTVSVERVAAIEACAYYDRAADAFNSSIALARMLLGLAADPKSPEPRRPLSPLEGQSAGLFAGLVEPHEIEKLIRNGVAPFGQRVPGDLFDDQTIEDMIASSLDRIRAQTRESFPGLDPVDDAALDAVIADSFRDHFRSNRVGPDEGIERRERPNRRA